MWDTKIRVKYNINNKGSAEDYIQFLRKMKEFFGHLKWTSEKKTFTKAIDEYNYHIAHFEDKSH